MKTKQLKQQTTLDFVKNSIASKVSLVCILLFAFSLTEVEAKDVLGFNFCGKVSLSEIERGLSKVDATLGDVNTDDETGEVVIVANNYKIDDASLEVHFSIYKDRLYKIEFQDGGKVSKILEAKYGLLRRSTENDGTSILDKFFYKSNDNEIDIYQTYGRLAPIPGLSLSHHNWNTATYVCKSIQRSLTIETERIERRKQLKKKGANQL